MLSKVIISAWLLNLVLFANAFLMALPMLGFLLLAIWFLFSFFLFRNTLNKVQIVGSIYWITRDLIPTGTPLIARGEMRETAYPWRKGKGVQVRIPRRIFQIGVCSKGTEEDELAGLASAVGGRMMNTTTEEIRGWQ